MSNPLKIPASKCDTALPPPQKPPNVVDKPVAEKVNQMDEAKKPQDIKSALAIMGQICAKAIGIDNNSFQNGVQFFQPSGTNDEGAMGTSNHVPKSQSEKNLFGQVPFRQGDNSKDASQRQLKVAQTLLFAYKKDMKPDEYDRFYATLMGLDEGTLDEILNIINSCHEKKHVRLVEKLDSEAGGYEFDYDDNTDEKRELNMANGCKKKTRRTKVIDFDHSKGFKNFFKMYKKKNCDKPCSELLKCAKEAYKNLSASSRSRYRNLNRKKPACPPKRKRKAKPKPCSDSDSYDD